MTARHIVHVLTVADSLLFIDTLVRASMKRGFEVTIVTSPDEKLRAFGRELDVRTVGIEMPRKVTPIGDLRALSSLQRLFEKLRPAIVHAHTPKGGLLGTLAASATNVPVRLYHMRGLPFVTLQGAMRAVLQTTERIACSAATRVVCESHSLRTTALKHRLVSEQKSEVVLAGSNGVDYDSRFLLSRHIASGRALRSANNIPQDAVLIGFVGRLVRDKGVPELVEAFESLSQRHPNAWLLLVGGDEARDSIDQQARNRIATHPRIRSLGFTKDTGAVYAAVDLVVLPSHREGFPNVPLEAASMCRPVVSTFVDGCIDAVENGVTGTLVDVSAPDQLAKAIELYVGDSALRDLHGLNGRARIERLFNREEIANVTVDLYERELRTVSIV